MSTSEQERQAALREIDSEIDRLQRLMTDKQASLDADLSKHRDQMSWGLQDRLTKDIDALRSKILKLYGRRHQVEISDIPATPKAAQRATKKAAPKPKAVDPTEAAEDAELVAEASADAERVIAALGISDESLERPVSFRLYLMMVAQETAHLRRVFKVRDDQIEALTDRLTRLEAGGIVGVKYFGVWQRQSTYPAGALATYKGALWHANVECTAAEPGDGKLWTLAAKGGDMPVVSASMKVKP